LYETGLKEGMQQLGALRSSERWAEGAQTAASINFGSTGHRKSGRRMEEKGHINYQGH